ncbi:MAG: FecR family protein [Clostridiales bacterium]|nr:FecR family protein [Clostridiales bacterium]
MEKTPQRKITACLMVLAIAVACRFAYVYAAEAEPAAEATAEAEAEPLAEARIVSIFKIEGEDVVMTKGTPLTFAAKEGLKLHEGYTVATGKDSYCYLSLDDNAIVQMDQSSKVVISRASESTLSISMQSGSLLMDAGKQPEGQRLETRAGNTSSAVRGTIYILSRDLSLVTVTMIEGSGEVDNYEVSAGNTLYAYDGLYDENDVLPENYVRSEGGEYQIVEGIELENMDSFALRAVESYEDILLESGIITEEQVEALPQMIEEAVAAEAAAEDAVPTPKPTLTPTPSPTPRPTPRPTSSPTPTPVPTPSDTSPSSLSVTL